jgi:succinoglycan biosynthesis protein ExoM
MRLHDQMVDMKLSIIIATFRRPHQLRRCIASCLAQVGLEEVQYELIVVDNCHYKTAFDIVNSMSEKSPIVTYVHEPRSGIAFARNTGVEVARSPLIAFIDDDEFAEPNWAANLLATQAKHSADVVLGPVLAVVEEGSCTDPAFIRKLYTVDWPQSTGPFTGPGHTGNVLLRRDRCFKEGHAFNPQLGLTAGSDQLFFLQLARAHASIVWCREAIVHETIPLRRTTYSYILKRGFVHGQSVSRTRWLLSPPDCKAIAWFMMAGALQFLFYGLAAAIAAPISTPKAVSAARKAVLGLGKALWMHPFNVNFYGPTGST